jgi:hypothetical protein
MNQPASENQASARPVTSTNLSLPPLGFNKGVNDYLNHYVMVADAKASACLAAALAAAVIVAQVSYSSCLTRILLTTSLAAFAAGGLACGVVIFPRLPSGKRGVIFWEEIRSFASFDKYHSELAALTDKGISEAYARQNYLVSDVLHEKHLWLRRGIVLFGVGVAVSLLTYLLFELG